jgi:DNA-binding PadR family transcriptional regulator
MVEGMWSKRKRVYQLTEKGEETINIILGAYEKIENFVVTLCK